MNYLDYLYLLNDLKNKDILKEYMDELNIHNIPFFTVEYYEKQLKQLEEIGEDKVYKKLIEDIKRTKERR